MAHTAMKELLVTLRFYACGSIQIIAGRIIPKVSYFIALLCEQYINMPRNEVEINNVSLDFHTIVGFPNVYGTIDCTHVKIQSPGGEMVKR